MSALSKSTCQAARRQRARRRRRHHRAPAHKTQAPSRISGGAPAPLPGPSGVCSRALVPTRNRRLSLPVHNTRPELPIILRTAVEVGHQASRPRRSDPRIPTAVRNISAAGAPLPPCIHARRRGKVNNPHEGPPGNAPFLHGTGPEEKERGRAGREDPWRSSAIPHPHRF